MQGERRASGANRTENGPLYRKPSGAYEARSRNGSQTLSESKEYTRHITRYPWEDLVQGIDDIQLYGELARIDDGGQDQSQHPRRTQLQFP